MPYDNSEEVTGVKLKEAADKSFPVSDRPTRSEQEDANIAAERKLTQNGKCEIEAYVLHTLG